MVGESFLELKCCDSDLSSAVAFVGGCCMDIAAVDIHYLQEQWLFSAVLPPNCVKWDIVAHHLDSILNFPLDPRAIMVYRAVAD